MILRFFEIFKFFCNVLPRSTIFLFDLLATLSAIWILEICEAKVHIIIFLFFLKTLSNVFSISVSEKLLL